MPRPPQVFPGMCDLSESPVDDWTNSMRVPQLMECLLAPGSTLQSFGDGLSFMTEAVLNHSQFCNRRVFALETTPFITTYPEWPSNLPM
jgi:hypothetical protein